MTFHVHIASEVIGDISESILIDVQYSGMWQLWLLPYRLEEDSLDSRTGAVLETWELWIHIELSYLNGLAWNILEIDLCSSQRRRCLLLVPRSSSV